jgi:AcrR family transcriptional regulator
MAERRLLPAPERAASILAAASRAFSAAGYAATTIDGIAAEAGITKLIVYRHFGSKHDLYRAVLDQVRAALAAAPPPPVDAADPVAAAAASLQAYLAACRAHPDAFRLLVVHAAREPEFAAYAEEIRHDGLPAAEENLTMITDPVLRRWAARTIGATVDAAVLAWLDLVPAADPAGDAAMAQRLARVIAGIAAAAMDRPPDGSD